MKLLIKTNVKTVFGSVMKDSIRYYIEQRFGKQIEITPFVNWKMIDVANVFFCVNILKKTHKILASFFSEKYLLNLCIGQVSCGRYILAASSRSGWKYVKPLNRKFIVAGKIVKGLIHYAKAEKISKNFDFMYFDHTEYFEGIYFDVFLNNGVRCFYSQYPSFIVIRGENYSRLDVCTVRKTSDIPNISIIDRYMKERLHDPKSIISYYNVESVMNLNLNYHADIIVYAHSFSDAQLTYGSDGFTSVYDWLVYTLDILKDTKNKVLVKGHPNFYAKGYQSNVIKLDLKIWNVVIDKFFKYENIDFMTTIESNYSLLSKCDNLKTTLITHHGNAIIEGLYLGFNGVSSSCSPWGRQYDVCRMWSKKEQYRDILISNKIGFCNKKEVYRLINDLYLDDNKMSNKNHFSEKIAKFLCVDTGEFLKKQDSFLACSYKQDEHYERLVKSICDTIESIE